MKVIVGLSGGVDSSVTALLLKEQGHDVHGLFMKNWNDDIDEPGCNWETDVEDALRVCDKLDIPLNTVDLTKEYWDSVFSAILEEFNKGLTPNPDVLCNQEIKFSAFMQHAMKMGGERIATGHYARNRNTAGEYQLLKGQDSNKDQSYFLCRLNQEQLSRALFPVGELNKDDVRRIARRNEFSIHDKKDSTGICFIGERPFKEFLSRYIPINKGLIKSVDGEVMGEHDGVFFYTIGQRQGLGIGGVKGSDGEPWYVVDKDRDRNEIYVAQGKDNELLFANELIASDVHWIGEPPTLPLECKAKTRYRQPDQDCTVQALDSSMFRVEFAHPQKAITPGQYVVFYASDICLGGGVIQSTQK